MWFFQYKNALMIQLGKLHKINYQTGPANFHVSFLVGTQRESELQAPVKSIAKHRLSLADLWKKVPALV